jgi:hypothetical protein
MQLDATKLEVRARILRARMAALRVAMQNVSPDAQLLLQLQYDFGDRDD